MLSAVLDAGVLISALLSPRGAPAQLLAAWSAGRYELVVSPHLLGELEETLRRPKFEELLPADQAGRLVDSLHEAARVAEDPEEVEPGLTPDPKDDYLVALARHADADVLVSGDRDLTELSNPDPPVLSPREFLDLLGRAAQGEPS